MHLLGANECLRGVTMMVVVLLVLRSVIVLSEFNDKDGTLRNPAEEGFLLRQSDDMDAKPVYCFSRSKRSNMLYSVSNYILFQNVSSTVDN